MEVSEADTTFFDLPKDVRSSIWRRGVFMQRCDDLERELQISESKRHVGWYVNHGENGPSYRMCMDIDSGNGDIYRVSRGSMIDRSLMGGRDIVYLYGYLVYKKGVLVLHSHNQTDAPSVWSTMLGDSTPHSGWPLRIENPMRYFGPCRMSAHTSGFASLLEPRIDYM